MSDRQPTPRVPLRSEDSDERRMRSTTGEKRRRWGHRLAIGALVVIGAIGALYLWASLSTGRWWIDGRRRDRFCAFGNYGQYIYVDPLARVVVVRLGSDWGFDNERWLALFRELADQLGGAAT
jgi:CubicO group peptidase (beta-lactamase class C family)